MCGIKKTGMNDTTNSDICSDTDFCLTPSFWDFTVFDRLSHLSVDTSAVNSPEKGKHTWNDLVRAKHVTL